MTAPGERSLALVGAATALTLRDGTSSTTMSARKNMHELSLAQSICQIVTEHVAPGQQVKTVVVDCGPLSGVVPEALEFCFPIAAASAGLGDEVRLQLRRLTAPARCPACDATFEVDQMWASCPDCEHVPVTVTGGSEFRLKEIEVSDG